MIKITLARMINAMRKRSLILTEVMVALGIASLLLAVLFPYFRETMRIKKQIEMETAVVFAKAHVQTRLATLFSKMKPSSYAFKTIQEKDQPLFLQFKFNNGYDSDDNFRDTVTGNLLLEKGKLILKISGKENKLRKEVLLEELDSIDLTFTRAKKGIFDETKVWEEKALPLFFVLKVMFSNKKEEVFYFRLNSPNHLEYP